jgi:hypothetical protein
MAQAGKLNLQQHIYGKKIREGTQKFPELLKKLFKIFVQV